MQGIATTIWDLPVTLIISSGYQKIPRHLFIYSLPWLRLNAKWVRIYNLYMMILVTYAWKGALQSTYLVIFLHKGKYKKKSQSCSANTDQVTIWLCTFLGSFQMFNSDFKYTYMHTVRESCSRNRCQVFHVHTIYKAILAPQQDTKNEET